MKVKVVVGHLSDREARLDPGRTRSAVASFYVERVVFDCMAGTVDVRVGDELTLNVSLSARSRPKGNDD